VIRIEASPRPRVRVIGSLDGRAVRALFEAISRGSVVLDLSEVDEAKESAVMFIARLPRERCRLAACPRWLSWWLKRLRRTPAAMAGETGAARTPPPAKAQGGTERP
jgi:hypothetical protein